MIPIVQVFIDEALRRICSVQLPPHVGTMGPVELGGDESGEIFPGECFIFCAHVFAVYIGKEAPGAAVRPERLRGLAIIAFRRLPCERENVKVTPAAASFCRRMAAIVESRRGWRTESPPP